MRLYSYWRSSASWRVRIALGLKGVAYEYVPVHLVRDGGEQRSKDYAAKNPMQQVPTLEWEEGGVTRRLTQSLAICEYLDATVPRARLVPTDPYAAARTREMAEIINAGTQPLQNLSVMQKLKDLGPAVDVDAWCRHWIGRGLAALESKVAGGSSAFAVGDAPSLVDVCVVPQLYNARRFALEMAPYPTLLRIEQACEALPAFALAHPDRQPDAPAPTERTP